MPKLREMRWDCERHGCLNQLKRLKLGVFDDCFPGRNGFGDVDAIIERNGRFLILEWKDHRDISNGQRIMFERLTQNSSVVVVVVQGDAETMAVEAIQVVKGGKIGKWESYDLECLKLYMRRWEELSRGKRRQ